MRFVAALDTIIFGVTYAQGAEVDTSTWTRKMLLQFLSNGIIQAAHLTAGSISDKLVFEGDGVTYTINGQGQVVVDIDPPAPAFDDLTDVDMTGVVNGQVPVWDGGTSLWKPGTPSGGGGVPDYRWSVPTGATSVDEFNGASLNPAWVRADGTGAVVGNASWLQGADGLSMKNVGAADTASRFRGLLRPIGTAMVVGDAFETCLTLMGQDRTNYSMGGLLLSDTATHGAGTQVLTLNFITATGQTNDARAAVSFNQASQATSSAIQTPVMRLFIRLIKLASNTWRTDVSMDGFAWTASGTITSACVPTYVGFLNTNWGNPVRHTARYEYLRRYSGVT